MPIYNNAPRYRSLAALLLVAGCGSSDGETNEPPTIAGVTLSPGSPLTTDDLVAMPGAVSDPEGDTVTLSYAWTNNGTPVANTSNTVPASETVKDSTWQVTVTPNDGEVDGQPVTASVTVGNAPAMVTMNLGENHLPGTDNILCNATQMDADGDVVLNFTWLEDGVAYAGPFSSTTFTNDTLPANAAHSGHIYTCEVSYNDGSGLVKLTRATTAYPNLILVANDTLLAGDYLFHEVSIPAGVTLTTQGLVNITAKSFNVAGVVSGNGQGNAGGAATASVGAIGVGPGAGTPSSPLNSGSGGGSYGGVGGTGGFDLGDTPGVGGAIYGTDSAQTIETGSGGAASDLSAGGAGGGALRLSSKTITVSGSIEMNGASGQQPGSGRGGGGGSGGGILIIGGTVALTGTLSANGGGGSIGTSTANDDGGGGGGGRIKIFHQGTLTNTATVTVNGGAVGTFGTGGPPTAGGIGVVHIEALP